MWQPSPPARRGPVPVQSPPLNTHVQTKAFCGGGVLADWVSSSSSEAALPGGKVPLSGLDLLHEHSMYKPLTVPQPCHSCQRQASAVNVERNLLPSSPCSLLSHFSEFPSWSETALVLIVQLLFLSKQKSLSCWHFSWHCIRQELWQTQVASLDQIFQVSEATSLHESVPLFCSQHHRDDCISMDHPREG